MKTFVLVAFVALCATANAGTSNYASKIECLKSQSLIQTRLGESAIIKKIEELREKLKNEGLPAFGIESLDQVNIPDKHLELDNTLVKTDLKVQDVHADGLLGFVIENMKLSILTMKLTFTINFPKVEASVGNYAGDLVLKLLDNAEYTGNGNVVTTITDFRIKGTAKVALTAPQIRSVDVDLSVGGFNFKITGLNNDEELSAAVSERISARVPELLKELKNEINAIIKQLLDSMNNTVFANTFTRNTIMAPWINCGGY